MNHIMKIALIGYGKMGKEIEKLLPNRGHQAVLKITKENPLSAEQLKGVDVAIEFSTPEAVLSNINILIENNIPTVVGTTGWNSSYDKVRKKVEANGGALVHASNFSIGVNLFFQLNEQLAKLMSPYEEYTPSITEIHHTEKLDAPSGTAISLANGLLANYLQLEDWYCLQSEKNKKRKQDIQIEAIREDDVKGTHTVEYKSAIDTLSIKHEAHNRQGFALGAIIAAEWIHNKKGIYTMKDVLQLS